MSDFPLAAIIAAPAIAAFVIFVLLPRMRKDDEIRNRRRR
jgi:hypothetical protein